MRKLVNKIPMEATSKNNIKAIRTDSAPAPVGPYNQAVKAGEWVFCSGQIALNPLDGSMVGGGVIQQETRQVMKNLLEVLKASGAKPSQVVRTTIYLVDLSDFKAVNSIYAEIFNESVSPARACVQVAALPKGALVEIDCVAWLG